MILGIMVGTIMIMVGIDHIIIMDIIIMVGVIVLIAIGMAHIMQVIHIHHLDMDI